MLKGKSGRFRQNLLGKRVDYSGRSVIVIGPNSRFTNAVCPRKWLGLFETVIIRHLKELGYVHTVRSAKKLIERQPREVWDVLEEVTRVTRFFSTSCPDSSQTSILAFEPVLIEGEASVFTLWFVRLLPRTSTVTRWLSTCLCRVEAQMEARLLMLSAHNIFNPSSGKPIMTPTQDITLGVIT
jgi:DNA-directed RNA polymerase subunit beta'